MSEQREALAEDFWRDFSRSTPEKFWDAAFWRDKGWLPGSIDVADRKRIVLGVLRSDALARLLADAEQRGADRVAAAIESRRNEHWQQHLREHPHADARSCPGDYAAHDAYYEAAKIARAALTTGAVDRVRAMNPGRGPWCGECRLGLGVHEPRDPQCALAEKDADQ